MEIRDALNALSAKKSGLKRELEAAPDAKPLLHASMADLYRAKVLHLREALEQPDARPAAAEALRDLIDAIVLKPSDDGSFGIFVEGTSPRCCGWPYTTKRHPSGTALSGSFR